MAAFAVAAAIPTYYALRGGSYDIVVRQEEAVVLWLVLGLGFLFGLLPRARFPRWAVVPLVVLGLYAVWTLISLSWTSSDERTLAEFARVAHLGGVVVLVWALVDRSNWRAAAGGLAFAAVLVASLAVASRLLPDSFPSNVVGAQLGTNRLNYPFNYWNAVGAWSAMGIAMTLAWSAHARWMAVRAATAAVIPVCGLAVYLTYSRAGVGGSALAVAAVLVLSRNRWVVLMQALAAGGGTALAIVETRKHHEIVNATGGAGAGRVFLFLLLGAAISCAGALFASVLRLERLRVPRLWTRAAVAAGLAAAVLIALTVVRHDITKGWHEFRGASLVSGSELAPTKDPASRLTNLRGGRYLIWRSTLRAFRRHPADGIGAGAFEFWWNRDRGKEFVRDAHSIYLEQFAELGVPGGLLMLAFLLSLLVLGLLRRARTVDRQHAGAAAALLGAFAVYLLQAGVDWMWESTAVTVLALSAAALALAPSSPDATPGGARLRLLPRLAIALVALFALLAQLPGLVSTSQVRDSQRSFRAGHFESALGQAKDAVDAQPWAASPYAQRALVEEGLGNLGAARIDADRAIAREPTNWRHRLMLARIDAERGHVRDALRTYRAARRLRPASPFFQQTGQPLGP